MRISSPFFSLLLLLFNSTLVAGLHYSLKEEVREDQANEEKEKKKKEKAIEARGEFY